MQEKNIELTEEQKAIYNIYNKELAIANNRPYQNRKNFDNLDNTTKLILIKLDFFFKRNPEIIKDLYFKSGFKYQSNTFLPLSFFYNISVLKNYNRLLSEKYNLNVDSPESVKDFIEGLKFIIEFVRKNKINLKDYPNSVNEHGVKWILIHLKQQKISLYHFHCFNVSLKNLGNDDIMNLYLTEFRKKFCETKRQYLLSKRLKEIGAKVNQTN